MRIGILALQGGFMAHRERLCSCEVGGELPEVVLVRRREHLEGLDGLILPGGESTTQGKLIRRYGLEEGIRDFYGSGGWILATCAGLILVSREVYGYRDQFCFGFLDIVVERNAYGSQRESFQAKVSLDWDAGGKMEGVFIRAPRVREWGEGVEVMGYYGEDPVFLRGGRCLGLTFHPELTLDVRVHRYFLECLVQRSGAYGGQSDN